jgi:hypothetical protein
MRRPRRKRVTQAKIQRAIGALVEILECDDAQALAQQAGEGERLTRDVDQVCDLLRKLQPRR